MPHEVVVAFPETARPEGDVGHLEARPPERAVPADAGRRLGLDVGRGQDGARREGRADAEQRAAAQELTPVDAANRAPDHESGLRPRSGPVK